MKRFLIILLAVTVFTACSKKQQSLSGVTKGMTKEEVLTSAGQPDRQNDIGETSIWTYPAEDRSIIFRHDTVSSIITSAEARLDSINNSLQKADEKIGQGLEKIGNVFDSTATRVKRSMDTLKKKD